MSLWPIDHTIVPRLASNKTANLGSGSRYSVFDSFIGFNASMRREGHSISILLPAMGNGQLASRILLLYRSRNKVLWNFLSNLSKRNIPGFGLRGADPIGANFRTLATNTAAPGSTTAKQSLPK